MIVFLATIAALTAAKLAAAILVDRDALAGLPRPRFAD
jgi:hypothetical protein